MSKTIKEVLQLHWMDGAKLSGGSYYGEPSLNAEEAMAEIEHLLEEAKPLEMPVQSSTDEWVTGYRYGVNDSAQLYHLNIKKILGEA